MKGRESPPVLNLNRGMKIVKFCSARGTSGRYSHGDVFITVAFIELDVN